MKTKESADQEIKEKTLQIKALEEEMEKLNVSYFKSTLKSAFQTVELNKWRFCHNIEISPKWPILIFSTLTWMWILAFSLVMSLPFKHAERSISLSRHRTNFLRSPCFPNVNQFLEKCSKQICSADFSSLSNGRWKMKWETGRALHTNTFVLKTFFLSASQKIQINHFSSSEVFFQCRVKCKVKVTFHKMFLSALENPEMIEKQRK